MKVLVLFGSKSDSNVFDPLCGFLKELGHDVQFEVISAHRNPVELDKCLKESTYDVVVAGAGLAAHLPGVVASKTDKPVFGIPVEANFGGVDALFSIMQMPFGVPVLTTAPGKWQHIGNFLDAIEDVEHDKINIVIDPAIKPYEYVQLELDRTEEYLKENNLKFDYVTEPRELELNIVMVHDEHFTFPYKEEKGVVIHVPILEKTVRSTPHKAFMLYEWVSKTGGLWVGANNTRNAVKALTKFIGR